MGLRRATASRSTKASTSTNQDTKLALVWDQDEHGMAWLGGWSPDDWHSSPVWDGASLVLGLEVGMDLRFKVAQGKVTPRKGNPKER